MTRRASKVPGGRIVDELFLFASTSKTPSAGLRPHQFSRLLSEHPSLESLDSFDEVLEEYLSDTRQWPAIVTRAVGEPFLTCARALLREHRRRTETHDSFRRRAMSATVYGQQSMLEVLKAGRLERLALRLEGAVDLSQLRQLTELRLLILVGDTPSLWAALPDLTMLRSLHLCGVSDVGHRGLRLPASLQELVVSFAERQHITLPLELPALEALFVENAEVAVRTASTRKRPLLQLVLSRCRESDHALARLPMLSIRPAIRFD